MSSDKPKPAVDTPAPATDQVNNEDSSPVQETVGEQGATAANEEANTHPKGEQAEMDNPIPPVIATESTGVEATEKPKTGFAETSNQESSETSEQDELPSKTSSNITMEDVLAASDEQLASKHVHRGMVTTGEIIMLSKEGIVVDVSSKIEGLLPYNQLFEYESNPEDAAKYFKPGDKIQVYVIRSDIPNNTIVLSKKRADQERAWNLLQEIHDKKKPVEVEIVDKVKGGLVGNLGIRAFLPASHVDIRRVTDLAQYVNKRLRVKIIELNRKRNRVIISRRSILEDEVSEIKAETLKKLEPGYKSEGEVVEITDFGVFVNLGGLDGLVHRSELTHARFTHPREVVNVGDKVNVQVLDMDIERERINLSIKRLAANPWENVLNNYVIGQKISGTVTNLTQFGAFIEIEPGLEGLIHVSEMSWTKRVRHSKELLSEGDEVETMVLKIDTDQQRISLGLRQTQPDPWSSLPDRFPPGTEVTGPVTGVTEFGVFMEIDAGIEGLVHISELAHEHIEDVTQTFSNGDEITAVILNIDPIEQRASLSRKRLLPYSAGEGESAASGENRSKSGRNTGGRRGRRGRRNNDIDYDYSYASEEPGNKATPKLGDVYADLFAQFGLTETSEDKEVLGDNENPDKAVEASENSDAPSETVALETSVDEQSNEEVVDKSDTDITSSNDIETKSEKSTKTDEPEVDPENAIDAIEAAALLTAAFREGKRPAAADENSEADKTITTEEIPETSDNIANLEEEESGVEEEQKPS